MPYAPESRIVFRKDRLEDCGIRFEDTGDSWVISYHNSMQKESAMRSAVDTLEKAGFSARAIGDAFETLSSAEFASELLALRLK